MIQKGLPESVHYRESGKQYDVEYYFLVSSRERGTLINQVQNFTFKIEVVNIKKIMGLLLNLRNEQNMRNRNEEIRVSRKFDFILQKGLMEVKIHADKKYFCRGELISLKIEIDNTTPQVTEFIRVYQQVQASIVTEHMSIEKRHEFWSEKNIVTSTPIQNVKNEKKLFIVDFYIPPAGYFCLQSNLINISCYLVVEIALQSSISINPLISFPLTIFKANFNQILNESQQQNNFNNNIINNNPPFVNNAPLINNNPPFFNYNTNISPSAPPITYSSGNNTQDTSGNQYLSLISPTNQNHDTPYDNQIHHLANNTPPIQNNTPSYDYNAPPENNNTPSYEYSAPPENIVLAQNGNEKIPPHSSQTIENHPVQFSSPPHLYSTDNKSDSQSDLHDYNSHFQYSKISSDLKENENRYDSPPLYFGINSKNNNTNPLPNNNFAQHNNFHGNRNNLHDLSSNSFLYYDNSDFINLNRNFSSTTMNNPSNLVIWNPNTDSCEICKSSFGFFKRISHCRVCGICVCSSCFNSVFVQHYKGNHKVCNNCTSTR